MANFVTQVLDTATTNDNGAVRLLAVESTRAIVARIGETVLSVLPQLVPILGEILDDDMELVEEAVRDLIRELEALVGEPILPSLKA